MAQSSVCGSVLASQPPGTRRIGSSDQFPEWNGYAPPVDIGRFPVIISSPADPVSYTHLDVYKRQYMSRLLYP